MQRHLILLYGAFSYALTLGAFAYLAGFVIGRGTPTVLDGPARLSLPAALAVNAGLLALFGLQHSIMARQGFKRWLTRFVPQAAERSTYCLATCVALFMLYAFWQPMGGTIWEVESAVGRNFLYALYASGWAVVLCTSFLIHHFDLFGLRQVWLNWRGEKYTALRFRTPGPYRYVRHPLYVGWLMVFWITPYMTAAHLVFALGLTAYILIAIRYEERDLVAHFGREYAVYRRRTPMLIPRVLSGSEADRPTVAVKSPVA